MSDTIIYKNVTILAGKDLRLLSKAYIAVKNGVIEDLGTGPAPSGIDLNGAVIIPAFVNAHVHLADVGFKDGAEGFSTEEAVSPPYGLKYQYLSTLSKFNLRKNFSDALEELCRNGNVVFGAFCEGGAKGILSLRQALSRFPLQGIIFAEFFPLSQESQPFQKVVKSKFCHEINVTLKYADGVGIGDIAYFTDIQLRAIRTALKSREKKFAIHVAETVTAQYNCLQKWGKSEVERILEYGPDLLVHFTNPVANDLDLVAKAGIPIVCCIRTNCILGDGIPPLIDLIKKEVPLALGTDNLMLTSPNMFREMDWFSRLVRGQSHCANAVSAREVLSIATLGGARALGLDKNLGSLEPGKVASFIALDIKTINLRNTKNVYAAIVHRAEPEDIILVVSYGKEVWHKDYEKR